MPVMTDLKHLLDNTFGVEQIELSKEIKYNCRDITGEIVKLKKKGLTWKMLDRFNNEFTLGKQCYTNQYVLYKTLKAMSDTRCLYPNRVMRDIE